MVSENKRLEVLTTSIRAIYTRIALPATKQPAHSLPLSALLLVVVSFFACSDNDTIDSSEQAVAEPTLPNPPEQLKLYVFHGTIGTYNTDALMNLVFEGDSVLGSYYYFKNLGRLGLNGNIDPLTNELSLVESYNGKNTGYFKGIIDADSLKGSWSSSPDFSSPQPFDLQVLKIIEVGTKPLAPHSDARYRLQHEVEIWDSEKNDFEKASATDQIVVRFIDEESFSFHYQVSGHNGHQGRIAGIGEILNLNQGIFKGEEGCELLFDFYEHKLDITATSCAYYAGQRASFGGQLVKF